MSDSTAGSLVVKTKPCFELSRSPLSRMCRGFFSSHARMNLDLHVYLLAELIEHGHRAVNGEAVKLYFANTGKVRMTDSSTTLSLVR